MSAFSLPTYLLLTPKGYFFRMRVPKHLQGILHKNEIKKAIGGADRRLAERQALLYAAQAIELFNSLEGAPVPHRLDMVVEVGKSRFILDKKNTEKELQMLIEQGIISKLSAVSSSTTDDSTTTSTPPDNENKIVFSPKMFLSEATEAHITDIMKSDAAFDEHKQNELRAKYNLLIDIIGNKEVGQIDDNDADKYREIYIQLPRNRTSKERQAMTIQQLIDLRDPVRNTKNTINQRIDTISSLFEWLKPKKAVFFNPFYGKRVKRLQGEATVKTIKKRLPFDADDLTMIFSDCIWTKHVFNHDWEYWLPLIALYTGARITEVCQLVKDDFREVDGVWHMSINDLPTKDEPGDIWPWMKRVKTENAVRDIPIHSHLLELGLRKFVESSPTNRIFPDIKPIAGKLAKEPCRRFNDYVLKRVGVKITNVKTLYSLRHTVMNTLKQFEIPAEERAQLAGHAPVADDNTRKPTVTTTHYGDDFNLSIMQKLVEMLDYSVPLKQVLPWKQRARVARGARPKKS